MDRKILAFDLDGTLLNANHEITKNTLQVIKTLKSLGHHIVIITGRSFNACTYYSKLIGADYTIACNGAFTFNNRDNTIYNKLPLEKGLSRQILKLLYDKKNHLKIQWDSIATYYSNNITPFESFYINNYKRDFPEDLFNHRIIEEYEQYEVLKDCDEEIFQIFFHPIDNCKKMYREALIELNQFSNVNIVDFKSDCTDINHSSATKGNGLKSLADSLQISRKQVVVFGDGDNDISMFEYAGLAVAMENACDEIKELSHMVTDNHDKEGVANALQKIFKLKASTI